MTERDIQTDMHASLPTHIHRYIHTYKHAYIYRYSFMSGYTHTDTYRHTYIHTYIHTFMHVCTCRNIVTYIYSWMCVHTYTCHTGVVYDNISIVFVLWASSINKKVGLILVANVYLGYQSVVICRRWLYSLS